MCTKIIGRGGMENETTALERVSEHFCPERRAKWCSTKLSWLSKAPINVEAMSPRTKSGVTPFLGDCVRSSEDWKTLEVAAIFMHRDAKDDKQKNIHRNPMGETAITGAKSAMASAQFFIGTTSPPPAPPAISTRSPSPPGSKTPPRCQDPWRASRARYFPG